jgi:transcriptional regulator with XRE-family HTH domain
MLRVSSARYPGRVETAGESAQGQPSRVPAPTQSLVIGHGQAGNPVLGRIIRDRRKVLERRAEDLAGRIGVTASYIRSIERGERAPAPSVAMQLLRELDLAPTSAHTDGDLEFVVDGRRWRVDFKNWTPAVGTAGVAAGAVLGGQVGALAGAAVLARWTQQRTQRVDRRMTEHDDDVDQTATLGELLRLMAQMPADELRDVAAVVKTVHEEHVTRRRGGRGQAPTP